MTEQNVKLYLATNAKYFPPEKIPMLKDKLLSASEDGSMMLQSVELKDPTTMLLISLFLGGVGVDRFMLGDTGMGVLKLLTFGGFGIIALVDLFSIQKKTREYNFNKVLAMAI